MKPVHVLVLFSSLFGIASAQAQGKPRILASYDDSKEPTELKRIALRPNAGQKVYFFVDNSGNTGLKDAAVRLMKVKPGGAAVELANAKLTVAPRSRERITFAVTAPPAPTPAPPAPGKPPEPATAPPPGIELDGPPFGLELWLIDAPGAQPVKTPISVVLMEPREYVKVLDVKYQGDASGKNNLLQVRLQAAAGFSAPADKPCIVELDLQPDKIAGLDPARKGGAHRQQLTSPGQEVRLFANLSFRDAPPKDGIFSITVDGYKRAYLFRANFSAQGQTVTPDEIKESKIQLGSKRFSPPTEKLPVTIEVDNSPADATIDVVLDSNGPVAKSTLRGDRQQRIYVNPAGPDGSVVFETEVKDWVVGLNTAGLFGTCKIDARLSSREKELSASKEITFDSTPPENVRFINLPRQVTKGATLLLKAAAEDPESQIAEATFLLGRPTPDKKAPDGAIQIKANPPTKMESAWTASLALPGDKTGMVDISVQFTNGAGQSEWKTETLQVVEAGIAKTEKTKGSIEGIVLIGDRLQPGVDVVLLDEKGAEKARVKTGDKDKERGKFLIKDVEPGKYRIMAAKKDSGPGVKGQVPVDLKEGEHKKGVEIKLAR